MKTIQVRNAQRARKLRSDLLRDLAREVIERHLRVQDCAVAIRFISRRRMAALNWEFLRHEGSTDVITFDYSRGYEESSGPALDLSGEIFICVDEAIETASALGIDWRAELARYLIHGLLHLRGFDDKEQGQRRIMKKEENRMLKLVSRDFDLRKLGPEV